MSPDLVSDAWLKQECDGGAFQRGKTYFEQGRARVTQVREDPSGIQLEIHGLCDGSAFEPYAQTVDVFRHDRGWFLRGHCSCPVGFNCKHVVALMLTWRAGHATGTEGHGPMTAWLERMRKVEQGATSPQAGEEYLLYILKFPQSRDDGLRIEFAVARPGRSGGWTRGRKTSISTLLARWHSPAYVRSEDEDILGLIRAGNPSAWNPEGKLSGQVGHLALQRMVAARRLFIGDDRLGPVKAGEPRPLHLAWEQHEGLYQLRSGVGSGGKLLPVLPPLYIDPDTLELGQVELPEGLQMAQVDLMRQAPPIQADAAARASFDIARSLPALPTPVPVEWEDVRAAPAPQLAIRFRPEAGANSRASLAFDYQGEIVNQAEIRNSASPPLPMVVERDDRLLRLHRDPQAEQAARQLLIRLGLEPDEADPTNGFRLPAEEAGTHPRDTWLAWIDACKPQLEQEGWSVTVNDRAEFGLSQADEIHAEVDGGNNDWFALRFDLEFDGWSIPLLPLVGQLLEDYRPESLPETVYLEVGEEHFVGIPAERIEPVLKILIDLFDRVSDEHLLLSRPDAASLADLDKLPLTGGTDLLKLGRQLRDFSGLKRQKLPTTFKGELRDYQHHGVDWLQFLRQHGLGGILADDMGLGKTIQALAHLTIEKRAGRMHNPCLIVAPTSLMGNWQREAQCFAPGLRVAIAQGSERAELFDRFADFDLVLTTYPLLPRDREALLAQDWHCLILDEAQQIKNPASKAARVVRKLRASHRLCLTGTPMENHLGELWAQFDFLMPGYLGDSRQFTQQFRTPIEKHNDGEALRRLSRRTAPFLLRRTKDRVAAELPPKSELLRSTRLTDKQALVYEAIRLTMEKKVRKAIAARGLARSHIVVLEALLKLRQVCCDPRLLPAGTPGARSAGSAKFELLFDLLPGLLEEGRRVLLFSQFTTMLGLIEKELNRRGITYTKLTGKTRRRDAAIERFTSGQDNLFLISLKAGGVGLNLVEADTVIHYDPWWNPAVEHQATDRAHRIGQDKPVFVYKLVTEGTVEEKILALQEKKQRLAESVQGSGKDGKEPPITEESIQALLAPD